MEPVSCRTPECIPEFPGVSRTNEERPYDYDAISDKMSEIFYQGFTEDEIRTFEEHLERIRMNLEGWQPK